MMGLRESPSSLPKHTINVGGMLTCRNTGQVRPSHEIEDGDCPACGRPVRLGDVERSSGGPP